MDTPIRTAAFEWLSKMTLLHGDVIERSVLQNGFEYQGKRITLLGPQGIWKPESMALPISITSVPNGPYKDYCSADKKNFVYAYRGTDPNHPANKGLRTLFKNKIPLIYFIGLTKGRYMPLWPVYIVGDEPNNLNFHVSVEELKHSISEEPVVQYQKQYALSTVMVRLHQQKFREEVIKAYSFQCSICRLKHVELLDAAHIIPDHEELGEPIIQNGLSLCKIHHAAFDNNIIGISPDYIIHVREDILHETDGPMLKYGIQSMNGLSLNLPEHRHQQPLRDNLSARYERFLRVG